VSEPEGERATLITFLLTDVEGSTRRWEHEPVAMSAALEEHDAMIDAAVAAHAGRVIKTKGEGDSTFSVFDDPADGVAAALAAQQSLAKTDLRVRMAIHTGAAETRGGDYYGPTVNRCARLRGAAHGGQVVVSNVVAELTRTHLPAGAALLDLGVHRLRDLADPEHVFQVCHPDIDSDFPPLASLDVRRDNLRPPLTTFIGRTTELDDLTGLVGAERLVTLVGPGGAGKTRLAIEVARRVVDRFADGVWVVELAAVAEAAQVLPAVAAVLGVREQPGATLRDAVNADLDRKSVLLVLDNCEHVADACAEVSELALASHAGATVLATSRQPLQLRGEQVWGVSPLSVPDSANFDRSDAVELFVNRARRVDPRFVLDASARDAVVRICRAVDGLPLAIELAAARLDTFSPMQLADRLDRHLGGDDRYDVLSAAVRNVDARQRTLANTIAWGYDLLADAERDAFAALAVFPDTFDLGAAETVVGPTAGSAVGVLVLKSLLKRTEERYVMLETIRAFASERLAASGHAGACHDRMVDWALTVVAGPRDVISLERNNLAAALRWAAARRPVDALRLAVGMTPMWDARGEWTEARRQLRELTRAVGDAAAAERARALEAGASLAFAQGDVEDAEQLAQRAVAVATETGDDATRGRAHIILGSLAHVRGDLDASQEQYATALDIGRRVADDRLVASALSKVAIVNHSAGRLEQAAAGHVEAIAAARRLGDREPLWAVLINAAITAESRGETQSAFDLYEEALALARELGRVVDIAFVQRQIGQLSAEAGDHARAEHALRESLDTFRDVGDRPNIANTLYALGFLAIEQRRYDDAEKLLNESVTLWQEVDYAFGETLSLHTLAILAFRRKELETALDGARQSLDRFDEISSIEGTATALELVAAIASQRGDMETAATIIGAIVTILDAIGAGTDRFRLVELPAIRESMGTAYDDAVGRGRALTTEEAVALARGYGR
jgi:predicted ATPase/class 3 adenylate cyclase